MPADLGVAGFLRMQNTYGWSIRRKFLWLGRHGCPFRNLSGKGLLKNNFSFFLLRFRSDLFVTGWWACAFRREKLAGE